MSGLPSSPVSPAANNKGSARNTWRLFRPRRQQAPARAGSQSRNQWVLWWRHSVYPGAQRKRWISLLLNHPIYRGLLLVLTFILLFGSQLRQLLLPPSADNVCNILLTVTFALFWLDIFMRMDSDPNYFNCSCGIISNYQQRKRNDLNVMTDTLPTNNNNNNNNNTVAATANLHRHQQSGCDGWCCGLRLGSFLFWCDFISTMTLLSEIAFINKRAFESVTVMIQLDQFGMPWSGLDQVNSASPVELDLVLLVTICKTARVARFIRSGSALKISSKVNWFWLLNLIDPCWYVKGLARAVFFVCGGACGREQDRTKRRRSPAEEFTTSVEDDPLFRRKTWAGLGLGALTAVRENDIWKRQEATKTGIRYWPIKMLRFVGLTSSSDNQWRYHLAATRIQRAWKRYKAENPSKSNSKGRGTTPSKPLAPLSSALRGSGQKGSLVSISTDDLGKRGRKIQRESQVGTAMRELTGQRVAIGIIIALLLTVLFTYTEIDATRASTMIVLHNQTSNEQFANRSLAAAIGSSIPDLYSYELANGEVRNYTFPEVETPLRPRETYIVTIEGNDGGKTVGYFALKKERKERALVAILSTIFILIVWFFGVTAFAGPVMVLVVIPIERMVRLLSMLMVDPLGYENSPRYKKLMQEEDQITKNTQWTKEVLNGMETSFLMSTILRIGSLMKVGFGSAGVEIIRNNLEKGHNKNNLVLNSQGSSVSCIFLFCDIRQFTDATECLQEEVFVFTNKIAAVVHSICTAHGGSANKNIGDAFLLSWLLDEEDPDNMLDADDEEENFTAKSNQADKALLSVVKICMALFYDDFYISTMSENARTALLTKLAKRTGPVVQMGFGLHAGKAVQGAIGSQRKIDATYISDNVERAEFLESSTKKYGVDMLMSGSFHRLLHPSNRRRCRKVDQLLLLEDDDDFADDYFDDASARLVELYTFDMDIKALWKTPKKKGGRSEAGGESDSESGSISRRDVMRLSSGMLMKGVRRRSMMMLKEPSDDAIDHIGASSGHGGTGHGTGHGGTVHGDKGDSDNASMPTELVLPTGPAMYNANVWVNEDMRKIRQRYSDGLFFQKFSSGLHAFYSKDWDFAKQCFTTILDRFEDGPSRYFLNQIEEFGGVPPKGFKEYGTA